MGKIKSWKLEGETTSPSANTIKEVKLHPMISRACYSSHNYIGLPQMILEQVRKFSFIL